MKEPKTEYIYVCPHCQCECKRDYQPVNQANCETCKKSFDPEPNWKATSTTFDNTNGKTTKPDVIKSSVAIKSPDDVTYWIGGYQFTKAMSFETKIEKIAVNHKPTFIEFGMGYAVMKWDLAHTCNIAANQLRRGLDKHEDWKLEQSGARLAIIDTKWKPNDDEEDKNEAYAG